MIITPELIEKAKMAIAEEDVCDPDLCGPDDYCQCRNYARAALTAILPDIVEAIAKVADDMAALLKKVAEEEKAKGHYQWADSLEDKMDGADDVAIAIRSLADKER